MSLVKVKFLGQRNGGQGGFIDEDHKHMLWGKGEVKEVSMQHAGVLMSKYPDLFIEVKDVVSPAPASVPPASGSEDEKAKMGLAVKNKQAEAPKSDK